MSNDRSSQISSIIEKRQPLAAKINTVETAIQALIAHIQALEQRRNYLLEQTEDPAVKGRLQELDLVGLQHKLNEELVPLAKLKGRWLFRIPG